MKRTRNLENSEMKFRGRNWAIKFWKDKYQKKTTVFETTDFKNANNTVPLFQTISQLNSIILQDQLLVSKM
jgi:hypothetical protein